MQKSLLRKKKAQKRKKILKNMKHRSITVLKRKEKHIWSLAKSIRAYMIAKLYLP